MRPAYKFPAVTMTGIAPMIGGDWVADRLVQVEGMVERHFGHGIHVH
ncbi:MAG TPA: hypothetical protein VKB67_08380 [Rhizomicrobium sp.]|nr:hypothetical protein [Rhizomicrobium sp.]